MMTTIISTVTLLVEKGKFKIYQLFNHQERNICGRRNCNGNRPQNEERGTSKKGFKPFEYTTI